MQGINTAIFKLGEDISISINNSNLPPVCVKLVLDNMLNQVIQQCNKAIIQEQSDDKKEGADDVVHES